MALQIQTITESIAALDVEGVSIRDMSSLKESFDSYDCPLLAPRPNDFVSAPSVSAANFGTGTSRKLDVSYTLTYRYFHAPIGTGDLTDTWAAMVINLFKIFDAILINDALTGLIDLAFTGISDFGSVGDGGNNQFHGCDITFRILEFVN